MGLRDLLAGIDQSTQISVNIYDGDTLNTPVPDPETIQHCLHKPGYASQGILPHHTVWKDFFTALRFIVIDEMHAYRGVFGSHVANVIRRLSGSADSTAANPNSF